MTTALGTCALGRALDANAQPLDGGSPLHGRRVSLDLPSISPSERSAVDMPFWTGVRAIDGLLTIGRGARVGIFGAPGAGKSTLLGSIVRGARADAVVVSLCGERGREARTWIDGVDARTTVICATGDRSAAERVQVAHVTFAHARALAERGLHVLVVFDSLARVAAALRERAVSRGESVGRGGYPPSVFAELARIVESAGAFRSGSITLLATVLNDGDDRDPVSESARSLLDGHVQLSPALARAGRFPAVDVPASTSRTMGEVVTGEHARDARRVRAAVAHLARIDDARALGLEPVDDETRAALAAERAIDALLRQGTAPCDSRRTLSMLAEAADILGGPYGHHQRP